MELRLGINTCFAVKRWPLATEWAALVRRRLGLGIVQHSFDLVDIDAVAAGTEDGVDDVRRACDGERLELHSTFTGLAAYSANLLLHPLPAARDRATRWFETAIRYTARLGGVATGGHVGAFAVSDWERADRRRERWGELQERLERLARTARSDGLEYLMVENLAAAREPSTLAMIRDLMTSGDESRVPIRLCLDVGHMCVPGTSGADRDPYAWLRELGRDAPIVQLQQSDAEGDHHWPFTDHRNRTGRIDADRVIDALGEGGVDRSLLVLEIIPPFEQDDAGVVDDMVASVDYWRAALERRGVAAD
ncbi:MAG TPA: TIM barrel protein [Candidatus Limnocylindrales bacterium]